MKLAAPLPAALAPGPAPPFEAEVSILSDLARDGRDGASWVGADARRIVALSGASDVTDLATASVTEVRVDELFGASRLVVVSGGAEHVSATYSRNMVAEFALFARALDDLREGRPVQLPDTVERATCERCGAPLPERGATCPRCSSTHAPSA